MASTSSLKSVIKSEKFPCHRIPNQSIPPVIVINDGSQHSSAGNNDSNSESANGGHAASSPAASSQPVAATRAPPETMTNRPRYGRVVISLENPILPEETIKNTPSQIDGLDCETENDLRITGCKLIQISGVLLRLPQVAMATGQVLFQRYYYSKSFVRFPMEITAMACVVLASKVEEAPRRIRDIINVFHNMKQIRLNQPPVPMFLNEAYVTLKNNVIKAERRILKELGFCVHVKHPHKYIITVAEILGNSKNAELIQAAWSYMNDSLQSNVFVRFSPETIACACIHLSARILREPLPTRPPWHLVFGVDTETINQVCTTILQLYTRTPLSQEELEEKVDCARRAVDDAKVKARAQLVAQNAENPSSVSTGLLDSLVDSRTNSPIKYSDHGGAGGGGGGISSKLEVISALNRVKQHQASGLASKSSSPLVKSTIAATSTATTINVNSAQNSAANTPIKLEKSPRTLAAPSSSSSRSKRSRSPTPGDSRHSSTRRSRRSRSRSSPDDDRRSGHHQADNSREGDRYRNGHQNTGDYYAEGDSRPRQYRDANIDSNRSPTPPRSYITSRVTTVSNHNSSNSDYYSRSSAKSSSGSSYRDSRYDDNSSSSRYPSSSSSSNRYDYRGGSGQRGSDRHRDYEYEDSRRGGDRDRDRDRSDYRDHQDDYRPRSRDYRDEGGRGGGGGYEESGGARSRSRSPYQYRSSSSRDYHKSSSSSSSSRNKSRY